MIPKLSIIIFILLWATPISAGDSDNDDEIDFYQIHTPCSVAAYVPLFQNAASIPTPEIWVCKDGRVFRTKRGREQYWLTEKY